MRLTLGISRFGGGAGAGDTTPPVVTIDTAGPQDGVTGDVPLEITLVEAGGNCTVYVVAYTGADPDADQIQAGQNASDVAAADSWTKTDVAPGSGVVLTEPLVDGLNDDYKFGVVAVDPSGNVSAPVYSSAVTINTVSFSDPTSLGSKLITWLDFTDTSTLWEDTARTTAATTLSDPVRYVDDKSGNGNDFYALNTAVPGNMVVLANGVDVNDAGFKPVSAMTGLTSNMEVYALIERDGDTYWTLLGEDDNSGFYSGIAQSGSGSATDQGTTGTITHSVDNSDLTSPTRDTIYDAVVAAEPGYVTQGVRGIDLSGLASTLMPLAYNTGLVRFSGNARHFVITEALTTDERADLHIWFDGEK